jgi:anaerobic ribonucleoside-triphosphate reductase
MSDLKVGDACPQCGKPMIGGCSVPGCTAEVEVYSRIVGYLRPVRTWNDGKQEEFKGRIEYDDGFASRKIAAHQKSE